MFWSAVRKKKQITYFFVLFPLIMFFLSCRLMLTILFLFLSSFIDFFFWDCIQNNDKEKVLMIIE